MDPLALPPGWLLNGAAGSLFVAALWRGSERTGDLGSPMLIIGSWLLVLLAWLFRLIAGSNAGTIRSATVIRWALGPSLFVVAAAVVLGGYASGARFALSEGALDDAADTVAAGGTIQPGWIGLYPVTGVSAFGESVRVNVSGQYPFVRDAPTPDESSAAWYEPVRDRWSYELDFATTD